MSIEKLSRTAGWTKRLRGVLELFNRCLGVCDDFNEARYAMVDVLGMDISVCFLAVWRTDNRRMDAANSCGIC